MQRSIIVQMVALTLCALSSAAFAEDGADTVDSPSLSSTGDAKEPTPADAKEDNQERAPVAVTNTEPQLAPKTRLMIGTFFYNPINTENWNVAFQVTYIWQHKPPFRADYSGPNSLSKASESGYTLTATLALGYRPWIGAEIFVNPEVIQSMEISNLSGLGGLSNGENQKSGGPLPKLYTARLFFRQTFNVGGDFSTVESTANQLGKKIARRRFVLTLGVLAVTDIFDVNAFSHDPRTQFINWALWTYGATDYAADLRGYTWGIALEYYHDDWVFRIGRFAQPTKSNGMTIDANILAHYGDYFEIEHDHTILRQGGKIRMIGFNNHARMGNFRDALAYAETNGGTPEVANVRRGQSKYGIGINIEQSITQDAGIFVRFSFNDGQTETYAYAEIERSLALGGTIKGRLWLRPDDTLGVAYVFDGLSNAHRDYLAAGGLGFFLGDGRINYALEHIVEVFYSFRAFSSLWFSLDYQLIVNPAYNADRGPANFFGCRFHVEY